MSDCPNGHRTIRPRPPDPVTWRRPNPGTSSDLNRADGSGHTVVFFGWLRGSGPIIGLRYWSSQRSTKGIGYNAEYFRDNPPHELRGGLMRAPMCIGHVGPVTELPHAAG